MDSRSEFTPADKRKLAFIVIREFLGPMRAAVMSLAGFLKEKIISAEDIETAIAECREKFPNSVDWPVLATADDKRDSTEATEIVMDMIERLAEKLQSAYDRNDLIRRAAENN